MARVTTRLSARQPDVALFVKSKFPFLSPAGGQEGRAKRANGQVEFKSMPLPSRCAADRCSCCWRKT
jgi:hypothetical protein